MMNLLRMKREQKMFKTYFKYGTMASGKTAELLMTAYKYEEKGLEPLYLAPSENTRDNGEIKTRIGLSHKVDYYVSTFDMQLKSLVKWAKEKDNPIFIDEAQFINPKVVKDIVNYCQYLESIDDIPSKNFNIFAYGLLINFKGTIFEGSQAWLELADSIHEIKSICDFCERKACKHILLNAPDTDGEIVIESQGIKYYSVCQYHYYLNSKGRLENHV